MLQFLQLNNIKCSIIKVMHCMMKGAAEAKHSLLLIFVFVPKYDL